MLIGVNVALERLSLKVRVGGSRRGDAVDRMVRLNHYLRRWPGTAVAVFRLDSASVPVGVITYSLPPREVFKRYGVRLAWELSRLWITDAMPKNTETWFIAQTIHWLQRNRPDVELLVSYADPSWGHTGTIYRAGNWTGDGMTDEDRKTPRFDLVCEGKKYGRASHVPQGKAVERLPRSSKYRFIYRMTPKRAHGPAENTRGQRLLFAPVTRALSEG